MPPLALFRSLWGCNAHAPFRACRSAAERMLLLRGAGYDGVEASLADLGACTAERRDSVAALRGAGLELIVGVYASWGDYDDAPGGWSDLHGGAAAQLERFEAQLCEVAALGAAEGRVLRHVNAHSGSDAWSEDEAQRYFERALPLGEAFSATAATAAAAAASAGAAGAAEEVAGSAPPPQQQQHQQQQQPQQQQQQQQQQRSSVQLPAPASPSVSHETHRGRPLANPFVCHRLCAAFPALRLTLDASHWFLVCERLLGGHGGGGAAAAAAAAAEGGGSAAAGCWEREVLLAMCERVDHIHARVGTPEAPQLTEVPPAGRAHATAWDAAAAAAHEELWEAVWRGSGRRVLTATPEYGPVPYTPMAAADGAPLSDVWQETENAAGRLRELHRRLA